MSNHQHHASSSRRRQRPRPQMDVVDVDAGAYDDLPTLSSFSTATTATTTSMTMPSELASASTSKNRTAASGENRQKQRQQTSKRPTNSRSFTTPSTSISTSSSWDATESRHNLSTSTLFRKEMENVLNDLKDIYHSHGISRSASSSMPMPSPTPFPLDEPVDDDYSLHPIEFKNHRPHRSPSPHRLPLTTTPLPKTRGKWDAVASRLRRRKENQQQTQEEVEKQQQEQELTRPPVTPKKVPQKMKSSSSSAKSKLDDEDEHEASFSSPRGVIDDPTLSIKYPFSPPPDESQGSRRTSTISRLSGSSPPQQHTSRLAKKEGKSSQHHPLDRSSWKPLKPPSLHQSTTSSPLKHSLHQSTTSAEERHDRPQSSNHHRNRSSSSHRHHHHPDTDEASTTTSPSHRARHDQPQPDRTPKSPSKSTRSSSHRFNDSYGSSSTSSSRPRHQSTPSACASVTFHSTVREHSPSSRSHSPSSRRYHRSKRSTYYHHDYHQTQPHDEGTSYHVRSLRSSSHQPHDRDHDRSPHHHHDDDNVHQASRRTRSHSPTSTNRTGHDQAAVLRGNRQDRSSRTEHHRSENPNRNSNERLYKSHHSRSESSSKSNTRSSQDHRILQKMEDGMISSLKSRRREYRQHRERSGSPYSTHSTCQSQHSSYYSNDDDESHGHSHSSPATRRRRSRRSVRSTSPTSSTPTTSTTLRPTLLSKAKTAMSIKQYVPSKAYMGHELSPTKLTVSQTRDKKMPERDSRSLSPCGHRDQDGRLYDRFNSSTASSPSPSLFSPPRVPKESPSVRSYDSPSSRHSHSNRGKSSSSTQYRPQRDFSGSLDWRCISPRIHESSPLLPPSSVKQDPQTFKTCATTISDSRSGEDNSTISTSPSLLRQQRNCIVTVPGDDSKLGDDAMMYDDHDSKDLKPLMAMVREWNQQQLAEAETVKHEIEKTKEELRYYDHSPKQVIGMPISPTKLSPSKSRRSNRVVTIQLDSLSSKNTIRSVGRSHALDRRNNNSVKSRRKDGRNQNHHEAHHQVPYHQNDQNDDGEDDLDLFLDSILDDDKNDTFDYGMMESKDSNDPRRREQQQQRQRQRQRKC